MTEPSKPEWAMGDTPDQWAEQLGTEFADEQISQGESVADGRYCETTGNSHADLFFDLYGRRPVNLDEEIEADDLAQTWENAFSNRVEVRFS